MWARAVGLAQISPRTHLFSQAEHCGPLTPHICTSVGGEWVLGCGTKCPPYLPLSLGLYTESNLGFLDVTIMYKGRTVLQAMVGYPSCVFLYSPMNSAAINPAPQPVIFPSPAELPDQKQLRYTETLLQHVSPGLQLELRGPSLWALRMGKCKVYWEVGSPMGSTTPSTPAQLLERNCHTPIFDFSTFFRGQ